MDLLHISKHDLHSSVGFVLLIQNTIQVSLFREYSSTVKYRTVTSAPGI